MILLTFKEDIIMYTLKKWELKDSKQYNIFELCDEGGYDVFAFVLMLNNEHLLTHVLNK